jgi:hypothetical protein
MIFEDKFVAFVDVLGFSGMVEAAEAAADAGDQDAVPRLLNLLTQLGTKADKERFAKQGPITCPHSPRVRKDLAFELTQISDCVIVSAEVSPAGVINLVSHCWDAVVQLLEQGVMCRGYITRGRVYHTETQVLGSAYQKAYRAESQVAAFRREADERGTPFVEVDRVVADYVKATGDWCSNEMFLRMVADDGDVVALFPFKRFSHSFIIDRNTDPERERESNNNLRNWLIDLKRRVRAGVVASRPDAQRKAEHYIRALDTQLEMCDKTDDFINRFLKN